MKEKGTWYPWIRGTILGGFAQLRGAGRQFASEVREDPDIQRMAQQFQTAVDSAAKVTAELTTHSARTTNGVFIDLPLPGC